MLPYRMRDVVLSESGEREEHWNGLRCIANALAIEVIMVAAGYIVWVWWRS